MVPGSISIFVLYSFVLHFIELNGLEHMLDFLRRMNNDIRWNTLNTLPHAALMQTISTISIHRQSQLHYVIMGCIKALMNNPVRCTVNARTCDYYIHLIKERESSCAGTPNWDHCNSTVSQNYQSQDKDTE